MLLRLDRPFDGDNSGMWMVPVRQKLTKLLTVFVILNLEKFWGVIYFANFASV